MKRSLLLLTLLAVGSLIPGCLFARVTAPLAYRSPTPGDIGGVEHLGEEVSGRACNHAILGLVAFGDGGYAKALRAAKSEAGVNAVLADVRADTNLLNILSGIYTQVCTTVHARVVR